MGDDEVEKHNPAAAAIFKALGDENRWRILETLKEGERCACVLLTRMQISQSTLSHHMKVLCDAGLDHQPPGRQVDPLLAAARGDTGGKGAAGRPARRFPAGPSRCAPAPKRRRQLWRAKQNCMC